MTFKDLWTIYSRAEAIAELARQQPAEQLTVENMAEMARQIKSIVWPVIEQRVGELASTRTDWTVG